MMNRKRQWTLVLASLAAVAAMVVAACGGGGATATPVPRPTATPAPTAAPPPTATALLRPTATPIPTAAPTATPAPTPTPAPVILAKKGGILRLRLINDPATLVLDTYNSAGGSSVSHMMPLMSSFVVENPYKPGEIIGDVATSWSVSQDGKVWTFKMRQGVRFTDNTPLTAADVAWNFTQGWKPPAPSIGNTRSVWTFVTDIKAVDDATVQVTLSQPSASFLTSVSQSSVLLYPRHMLGDQRDVTQFNKTPLGSGAYFRSNYQSGQLWSVRRNPAYYAKDAAGNQLPYLDGIDYFIIQDPTAGQAAIRSGRVDLATIFDGTEISTILDALKAERNFQIFTAPGVRFDLILRNKAPWDNPKVRQAISMGIDRKTILDTAAQGRGTFLASPMVPPALGGVWGLPASELSKLPGFRQPHGPDLEEAKRILRAEGVKEGTPLDYLVFIRFTFGGEADVINSELTKLGFKVKVTVARTGPEIIEKLQKGDFDMNRGAAAVSFDDPTQSITPFIGTGQFRNFGNWSAPKIDQLLSEQDRTLDDNKRREIIFQLQREIIEHAGVIPVTYGESLFGWPPAVKNHPKWVFAFGPQWRYDQVWLER